MVLLSRYALFSFILSITGVYLSEVDALVQEKVLNPQEEWADWEVRSDFKCPTLFGSYPDTEDCTRFYRCIGGRPVHLRCGRAKQFDKYRRKCLSFIIAICDRGDRGQTTTLSDGLTTTVKGEKFLCPSLLGNFPYSEDCSMFYACRLFIPTLKQCPENQLFDGVKRECRPAHEVHCGDRVRPTEETTTITVIMPSTTTEQPTSTEASKTTEQSTSTEPSKTTEQPTTIEPSTITEQPTTTEPSKITEQSTSTEPSTITEQPTTIEPSTITEQPTTTEPSIITEQPTTTEPSTTEQPTATEPSTSTEQPTSTNEPPATSPKLPKPTGPPETDCDEDDLDCIITETGEIPDWFECPVELGAYRHPSNKKLFIYCQNWKPFVKKCGQDLIFSQEVRTCVSPDKVIPNA